VIYITSWKIVYFGATDNLSGQGTIGKAEMLDTAPGINYARQF
jgi:hypothetical protein